FMAMLSSQSTQPSSEESEPAASPLPETIRTQLDALGISAEAENLLHIQSDLDTRGHWSERHLVATPDRLLVFSIENPSLSTPTPGLGKRVMNRLSRKLSGSNGAADTRPVTIDLDVPLDSILQAETKSLSGASALELRVRDSLVNGAAT